MTAKPDNNCLSLSTPENISVVTSDWKAYALLDSGAGRKLERFGPVIVDRGEAKAWWRPRLTEAVWQTAQARHEDCRGWTILGNVPSTWSMKHAGLTFEAKLGEGSKHLGIFPEQAAHWEWIRQHKPQPRGSVSLLNLFGYTGAATLAAAAAGFAVTHLDASRPAVTWARRNQELSGMSDAPIRWIIDDAVKFVRREERRGRRYDALLLDPPSFGHGPSGEMWKAERDLAALLDACRRILSDRPRFVVLTLYAIEASSIMIANLLAAMMEGISGHVEIGELTLPHGHGERLLPMAIFGRWTCTKG